MSTPTPAAKLLKHKIYTDEYADYLRRQARARALEGLDLDALESCGAGLGQSEQDVEATRREWERKAQEAELENLERTLRRQREGLDLLIARGAALAATSTEACPERELAAMAQPGEAPLPATKYTVYSLRVE